MVLSPRRRRGDAHTAEAPLAPIQFRLDAREEQVRTKEDRLLTGRGYMICDARTGEPLGEDDFFFRIGGGMVCDLVDADSHLEDLQSSAFRPGRTLGLVREPVGDSDEPPRIQVRDSHAATTVGMLPDEVAEALHLYGSETYGAAFCLWEWATEDGTRFALRLLLAPGWTVEQLPEGTTPEA